jgi:hypothetical protein
VQLVEDFTQGVIGQAIDGDADGAGVVVLAQQRDAAGEVLIHHARHGDEHLPFQVIARFAVGTVSVRHDAQIGCWRNIFQVSLATMAGS